MSTTMAPIQRTVVLGGRDVTAQINEFGGSADIVFTAGESPDQEFFGHLRQAVDGYRHVLTNDGYRVLTTANDRAIKIQIGDVSSSRLELITRELEREMQIAWQRKPMARAATAG